MTKDQAIAAIQRLDDSAYALAVAAAAWVFPPLALLIAAAWLLARGILLDRRMPPETPK